MQPRKKLYEVYGKGYHTGRQCQRGFAHSRGGNFNVHDTPQTGRTITTDDDKIRTLIGSNRRKNTQEMAEMLGTLNTTVYLHSQ